MPGWDRDCGPGQEHEAAAWARRLNPPHPPAPPAPARSDAVGGHTDRPVSRSRGSALALVALLGHCVSEAFQAGTDSCSRAFWEAPPGPIERRVAQGSESLEEIPDLREAVRSESRVPDDRVEAGFFVAREIHSTEGCGFGHQHLLPVVARHVVVASAGVEEASAVRQLEYPSALDAAVPDRLIVDGVGTLPELPPGGAPVECCVQVEWAPRRSTMLDDELVVRRLLQYEISAGVTPRSRSRTTDPMKLAGPRSSSVALVIVPSAGSATSRVAMTRESVSSQSGTSNRTHSLAPRASGMRWSGVGCERMSGSSG